MGLCSVRRFLVCASLIVFFLQKEVNAADFRLQDLVPASVFTTRVPCDGCSLPGGPPPSPAPSNRPDPCNTCNNLRLLNPKVSLKAASRIDCSNCPARRTVVQGDRLRTSERQQNAFQALVMAIDKVRAISPPIVKYTGSVGGEGCTVLEKLLGVPGCVVTNIEGQARRVRTFLTQGPNSRFLLYQLPAGAKRLDMKIFKSGDCGRREGSSRCPYKAKDFALSGGIGDTTSPGCTKMIYNRKKRLNIFRCSWSGCAPTQFALRSYTTFTGFVRVTMSGSYVESCPSSTGESFFVI